MLVRLMYASRAAAAVDHEELIAILREAKANNPARASPACCASPKASSCRCSKAAAARSTSCTTASLPTPATATSSCCSYDEIDERRFAGWSMGQVNMARLNPALLLKYSEWPKLDPYAVSGKVSMALFEEMVATASIMGQS